MKSSSKYPQLRYFFRFIFNKFFYRKPGLLPPFPALGLVWFLFGLVIWKLKKEQSLYLWLLLVRLLFCYCFGVIFASFSVLWVRPHLFLALLPFLGHFHLRYSLPGFLWHGALRCFHGSLRSRYTSP